MPTALIAAGAAPAAAGQALGLTTAIGIPFGLLLSAFAGRFKSLAWWSAAASALTAIGFTIVLIEITAGGADVASRMLLGGLLIGMGQASTFPLSLSLIGSKASTKAQTTMLSALSQGWGYLFAAVGTLAIGLLADLTHGWVVPFVALIVASLVQIPLGFVAGRPGQIPASNRK
jgi:CP family cyanate transporter-like MFS transporter